MLRCVQECKVFSGLRSIVAFMKYVHELPIYLPLPRLKALHGITNQCKKKRFLLKLQNFDLISIVGLSKIVVVLLSKIFPFFYPSGPLICPASNLLCHINLWPACTPGYMRPQFMYGLPGFLGDPFVFIIHRIHPDSLHFLLGAIGFQAGLNLISA